MPLFIRHLNRNMLWPVGVGGCESVHGGSDDYYM